MRWKTNWQALQILKLKNKNGKLNKSLKSEMAISPFLFHGSVPPCQRGSLHMVNSNGR